MYMYIYIYIYYIEGIFPNFGPWLPIRPWKKKKIHSFWSTLIIYLLVVYKKNNNSFILVYFCQRSQAKLFLQNLQKTTQEQ